MGDQRREKAERLTLAVKSLAQLDPPFRLGAIHLEHRHAHHEYHKRGDELEYAFPEFLGLCPEVGGFGEPDCDEGRSDGEGDEQAEASP